MVESKYDRDKELFNSLFKENSLDKVINKYEELIEKLTQLKEEQEETAKKIKELSEIQINNKKFIAKLSSLPVDELDITTEQRDKLLEFTSTKLEEDLKKYNLQFENGVKKRKIYGEEYTKINNELIRIKKIIDIERNRRATKDD